MSRAECQHCPWGQSLKGLSSCTGSSWWNNPGHSGFRYQWCLGLRGPPVWEICWCHRSGRPWRPSREIDRIGSRKPTSAIEQVAFREQKRQKGSCTAKRSRHRDVWSPELGRRAVARRGHQDMDRGCLPSHLSHFKPPAQRCLVQALKICTYSQRKNKSPKEHGFIIEAAQHRSASPPWKFLLQPTQKTG